MPTQSRPGSYITEFCRLYPPPKDNHICSLYSSEEDFKASLSTFVTQAIHANAKIIYISNTLPMPSFKNYLDEFLDKENLTFRENQWEFFHLSDFAITSQGVDKEGALKKLRGLYLISKEDGYDHIHFVTVIGKEEENFPHFYALFQFESVLNAFITDQYLDCMALCQYNTNHFPSHLLNQIVDFHPQCLIGEKLYHNGFHDMQSPPLMEDEDSKILHQKLTHLLKQQNHKEVITKLYNQNEEFRQFSYMLAHDLKTHIRAAHLFNFIIIHEYHACLSPEIKELLEKMTKSLYEANTRIESLNLLLQATKIKENLDLIDLNEIIENVIHSYQKNLTDLPGQIIPNLKDVPPIYGDSTQITQLFRQLFDNCLKFRKPSIPLCIKIESHVFFNQTIKITITDNGQGFDKRYKNKIFQPFYRLHPEVSSGCGIGLSICQKIIQQHNGDIMADSEEEIGTTITLIFSLVSQ